MEDCQWVIIDSGIKRELVTSKYQDRVDQCKEAWKIILDTRDADFRLNNLVLSDIANLRLTNDILYRRMRHVVTENQRVKAMQSALISGSPSDAGEILNDSHESLRCDYEVSCQEIDSVMKFSRKLDFFYGGRIMGGGFGGSMICLI